MRISSLKIFILFSLIFLSIINCKKIDVPNSQRRIVSLAPSITAILIKIDTGKELVGITDYCKTTSEITKVGGFNNFNIELIASLNPTDIFCMDSMSIEMLETLNRLFGKEKIHPFVHPEDFEGIFDMINKISVITDREINGHEIIKHQRKKLKELTEVNPINDKIEKPTVLVEIYYPPYFSVGRKTFLNNLIELSGGVNALQTDAKWPNISLEDVYQLNPDIILKLNHNLVDESLKNIESYKKKNIYQPNDFDIFLQPGIDSITALELLKKYISNINLDVKIES